MKQDINNVVQDPDVIELGVASAETQGPPGGDESMGLNVGPVISDE